MLESSSEKNSEKLKNWQSMQNEENKMYHWKYAGYDEQYEIIATCIFDDWYMNKLYSLNWKYIV